MDLLSKPPQGTGVYTDPQFTKTGDRWFDLWKVNGNCDFGWFPAKRVQGIDIEIPIRLHIGNTFFGSNHINNKHGHWLQTQKKEAHHLVWLKLQTKGQIYAAETKEKHKFSLRISPAALMVLELRENRGDRYFSVVTLYAHPPHIDGNSLGRYVPKKMPIDDWHF